MDDLSRFRIAQDDATAGLEVALAELRAGRKRSHWIWYVFPQLDGLGMSHLARLFGLHGRSEAEAYLRDPVLRERLIRAIDVVEAQLHEDPPPRLEVLMGSRIDAMKLVSSLTLFGTVAAALHAATPQDDMARVATGAGIVLGHASEQGYGACAYTRRRLGDTSA